MPTSKSYRDRHTRWICHVRGKTLELYLLNDIAPFVIPYLDQLVIYYRHGLTPSPELMAWVAHLDKQGRIYQSLLKWGILPSSAIVRTLEELFEVAFQRFSQNPSTRKSINEVCADAYNFFDRSRSIDTVTPEYAAEFKAYLESRKNSPATINTKLGRMRAAFAFAVTSGWLDVNPFALVRAAEVKINEGKWIYTSREDFTRIRKQLGTPLQIMFCSLMRLAGMRGAKEAVVLQWEDIHDGTIKITSTKTMHHGGTHVSRVVPICNELEEVLKLYESATHVNTGPMFPKLSKNYNMNRVLSRVYQLLNLQFNVAYDLRKSYCTDVMLSVGSRDPKLYERLTGHDFIVGLHHYQIVFGERIESAHSDFLELFNSSTEERN